MLIDESFQTTYREHVPPEIRDDTLARLAKS